MQERSRDDRIESYYHESARDLAERLVDAEDQIAIWGPKIDELRALHEAGVDNWSGYDYAMEALNADEGPQLPTCPYTHAHTRHWCGYNTCRES